MKKVCIIVLLLCSFGSTSFAAETNWQWVDSDEYSTRFVMIDSPTYNGTQDYAINYKPSFIAQADMWVKVTYDYEGGLNELNTYGLSSSNPEGIKSMVRLHCDFVAHTAKVLEGNIIDADGKFIGRIPTETYIPETSRYAGVYYYVLSKLNETDDFKIYKAGASSWVMQVGVDTNKNGKKSYAGINKLTIRENNNHIYYSMYFLGLAPDNSINDLSIFNTDLDTIKNTETRLTSSFFDRSGDRNSINAPDNKQNLIYPNSVRAHIRDMLIKYCAENYDWVHRFDK